MKRLLPTILLWACPILLVPAVFAGYVAFSYSLALARGKLPFNYFPGWLWFAVFGICLVSGDVAVIALLGAGKWTRIIFGTTYLFVMAAILLWIHLLVASSWGDSL